MSTEQSRRNDAAAAERHKEDQELRRMASLGALWEQLAGALDIALSKHALCGGFLLFEVGTKGDIFRFHCDTCREVVEVSGQEASCGGPT